MSAFFKVSGIVLVIILVLIYGTGLILHKSYSYKQVKYGVTFSPKDASSLNLDWKSTYIKILDDLKAKNLRLPSYWDVIEDKENIFDFSQIDFMLMEAEKRGAKIILVLGVRQPRWPECHIPAWARKLTVADRQNAILQFVNKIVQRYKDNTALSTWQVENEPFLSSFGQGCDNPDADFLKKEVNLVKSLSNKTIILTDSGELGFWIIPMQFSDVFGTTLYRDVYSPIFGYATFPYLPYFYNLKSLLIRNLFAKQNSKTIIIELQVEPWSRDNNLLHTATDKQVKLFPLEKLKQNIIFGKDTGFDENYLWGVEWWYFMAQNNHPEYLEYAKTIFK